MFLYKYDKETNEYLGSMEAYLDPLESKIQGVDVIAMPPETTLETPPRFGENEVPVFNKSLGVWDIEQDFRGTSGFNKKTGEPIFISTLGPLPEDFTLERPVLLANLKTEKFEELEKVFLEEMSKEIEYKGVTSGIETLISLQQTLKAMGEMKYTTFFNSNKNEAISLTKEKLEEIIKFFSLRGILLPIIKAEKAKAIRTCRSKKALDEIELDFKLEERTKELMKLTTEEIDSYIEEHTK